MNDVLTTAVAIVSKSYKLDLEPAPHALFSMLFYMQGWHRALFGRWCFEEEIEVRESMPFVQLVYTELGYVYRQGQRLLDTMHDDHDRLLYALVNSYGRLSREELVKMHRLQSLPNLMCVSLGESVMVPKASIENLFANKLMIEKNSNHSAFLDQFHAIELDQTYLAKYDATDWTPPAASAEDIEEIKKFIFE